MKPFSPDVSPPVEPTLSQSERESLITQKTNRVREIQQETIELKQRLLIEGIKVKDEIEQRFHKLMNEGNLLMEEVRELRKKREESKETTTTNLEQDLTDLTKVETFTLDTKPINPKQVLEKKEATSTQAGVYTWDYFDNWIRPNIQDTTITAEPISITSFTLDRNMKGEELKKKLGKAKPFTIDQFATLISNQSEISSKTPKVPSPLDISGKSNLFLVEQADGSIVVVRASWDSGDREWIVSARDLAAGWVGGRRVFSRND